MDIRKSEGKYGLQLMQKMATVAATADGLKIEGNNFKVGALIGCPDMVLFACEHINNLEKKLIELFNEKKELVARIAKAELAFAVVEGRNAELESIIDSRDKFIVDLKDDLSNLALTINMIKSGENHE
jgi:hypothetical protein